VVGDCTKSPWLLTAEFSLVSGDDHVAKYLPALHRHVKRDDGQLVMIG
jgi:hypothetical protein